MKFCKRCNTETDHNKQGQCKPCCTVYHKIYLAANKEKLNARSLEYAAANRDKSRERAAAWAAANPERHKANCKAYENANRDKVRAMHQAWAAANTDKVRSYAIEWRKANPERASEILREWKAKNPDKVRECGRIGSANRRALKQSATGRHTATDIKELFTLQNGKCACCRASIKGGYHVDHIYALINGGSNDKYNLQLLCQPCNNQKHAKHPIDFMREKGFLL